VGDHFTILIFSRDSTNVKRYKIPKWLFMPLVVVIPALMVLAAVLGLSYVRNPEHAGFIAELQQKNMVQQKEIRFFSERIAELQNRIAQMKEFDSKLRVIANLEHMPSSLFGVGGPLLVDPRERTRNQQGLETMARSAPAPSIVPSQKTRPDEQDSRHVGGVMSPERSALPHLPLLWPTRGWIIADFGCQVSPGTGQTQMHEGVEISNSLGTPIVASGDGLVVTVGTDPHQGKMVVLSHGHGIVTRYGHLGEIRVEIGQSVRRGQVIGEMGNTGYSIGPHLYYEVRVNGIPTNPKNYLSKSSNS
jgi:murein DD-endopeptidase MepM/ murein hydrolase activator NlpD